VYLFDSFCLLVRPAQTGILLTERMPWQLAALVLGVIMLEYTVRNGYPRFRPRLNAGTPHDTTHELAADQHSDHNFRDTPAFVRRRLPLALVRVYGAECGLCQGVGCTHCAHTGLR
jgi:hypothetical protein